MQHEIRVIEELVFVTKLSFVPVHKDKTKGFRTTLSRYFFRWYDINSSELRAAGFKVKEVLPPALESTTRPGLRTRGEGLRSLEGFPKRFVLSVDDDTEFRSRCE